MNGIFLVNKNNNLTSRDVVDQIVAKFNLTKAGHAGTLDPIAEGLLIICVNKATIVSEIITGFQKEYVATAKIGIKTDTGDITGKIIAQNDKTILKKELEKAFQKFPKNYLQEVPSYSAVRVKGKRLYQYARENIEVTRPKREIDIFSLELIEFNEKNQEFKFKVLISKGGYIRSLIEDIVANINTYATMTSLVRTRQGDFELADAKTIENIQASDLISITTAIDHIEKIKIDFKSISSGQIIENKAQKDLVFFVDQNDQPLAIYKKYQKDSTKLKPWKMFKTKE